MVDFDLGWFDPELHAAVSAVYSGDPVPAVDLVASTRGDWARRELVVDVLGPVSLAVFDEIPDRPGAALLRASALCAAGWETRGGQLAAETERVQFQGMADYHADARECVAEAAAADPEDPVPWSVLLTCALGLPTDREEPGRAYLAVVSRFPGLYSATKNRLISLAPRWYGSLEEMFGFATAHVEDLPDGDPLLALVPAAHIEGHVENRVEQDATGGRWRRAARKGAYLRDWEVIAQVDAASDRLLAGPGTLPHPRSMTAHQVFAAFYLAVELHGGGSPVGRTRLARHIANAGPGPVTWPWRYFGDHQKLFQLAHDVRP
ncbi:hypothetical protein [Actinokineospora pegani]|uniref:hypothetical protein n=1 Tax=Actinokineospora pegani TaxID=2654637 RepID=UPI0012EA84DF|nr:hypothetical protein [Actinokineospora pegani]